METKYEQSFYLFPYEKIDKGDTVIIYGFGKVGKQYYQQILQNNYCEVKCIVDKNATLFDRNTSPVVSPEELEYKENVRVVVSVANKIEQKKIVSFLKGKGFIDNNIICTHHSVPVLFKISEQSEGSRMIQITSEKALEMLGAVFFERWRSVNHFLTINDCASDKLIRVGKKNDGGYIMYGDLKEKSKKVAYSFGISSDVSWDNDMADMGYKVYMYDHTINNLPYERKEFHFYKKGISDTDSSKGDLETLQSLVNRNEHLYNNNMILKMDVEGAEYGFILNSDLELLNRFDQLVMELHNLNSLYQNDLIEKALKKLTSLFGVIHVHANNYGDVIYVDGVPYPDTLEITLLNKKRYDLKESIKVNLPIPLDMPCRPFDDEIILGSWNNRG